tara:strand:- start:1878 stop:2621 length:744 start_codon:yes stop_codon:yes gene_type:complete
MRGERVNVGAVVYGPNGADVRMPEVRKLRHLTGHEWEGISEAYSRMLVKSASASARIESLLTEQMPRSEIFMIGKLGELVAETPEQYEAAIKKILGFFVDKPTLSRKEKQQKINSEISAMLKDVGVLAHKGQTIDDGKVIPRFVISEEKDIVADFAYKPNGLKVVSTLELRGAITAAHSRACEKGATLFFAKEKFGAEVKSFGVYAANPLELETHRGEIEILRSFADGNAFNWMDASDRQRFRAALY